MSGLVIEDPVTLAVALASSNVIPGDTLLLRAGTYAANYVVPCSGNTGNYITIKPYQDERVIINGQATITGSYVRLQGLEIVNNTSRNRSASTGTVGVDALGNYNQIVNCIIRDHDQGITTSKAVTGHVYYGNLLYFNGWDSNQGHGMYPQNNAGNVKTIKRNIVFDNFGYGLHCVGSNHSVDDFAIVENTGFDNGEPRGAGYPAISNAGSSGVSNSVVYGNMTYNQTQYEGSGGATIGVGDTQNPATNASVYNNFVASTRYGITFGDGSPTITRFDGNTVYGWLSPTNILSTWADNTNPSGHPSDPIVFPASGSNIFLTSNEYDANRAQLTIYNWTLGNTVDVDVSAIFGASGTVKAYNVQDYPTDVQTLTITAGVITVNMQAANRTVATPVGWTAPATTFPQFGCLVLVKV
jgi:hypothetical protein